MRTNQLISWWIDPFVLIHSLDSFQSSIANQCIVLDDKILRFHISMYDISLSSRKQRNKNVEIKQSVILMSPQRYLITPPPQFYTITREERRGELHDTHLPIGVGWLVRLDRFCSYPCSSHGNRSHHLRSYRIEREWHYHSCRLSSAYVSCSTWKISSDFLVSYPLCLTIIIDENIYTISNNLKIWIQLHKSKHEQNKTAQINPNQSSQSSQSRTYKNKFMEWAQSEWNEPIPNRQVASSQQEKPTAINIKPAPPSPGGGGHYWDGWHRRASRRGWAKSSRYASIIHRGIWAK